MSILYEIPQNLNKRRTRMWMEVIVKLWVQVARGATSLRKQGRERDFK